MLHLLWRLEAVISLFYFFQLKKFLNWVPPDARLAHPWTTPERREHHRSRRLEYLIIGFTPRHHVQALPLLAFSHHPLHRGCLPEIGVSRSWNISKFCTRSVGLRVHHDVAPSAPRLVRGSLYAFTQARDFLSLGIRAVWRLNVHLPCRNVGG